MLKVASHDLIFVQGEISGYHAITSNAPTYLNINY